MAEEGKIPTKEYEEDTLQKTETEKMGLKGMTPWEQHSAVISLPRFDYSAPSSLLRHSHSGFLITCTIKREKSATKEAITILEKYAGRFNSGDCDNLENTDKNSSAKKRRICTENFGNECSDLEESKAAIDNSGDGKFTEGTVKAEEDQDRVPGLSLVKLTRSGLVLFTFPRDISPDTVDIVSHIIRSLESGSIRSPAWCHRIFPFQATCCLNEKELQAVVSMLVKKFVSDNQDQLGHPLKFAVGYNRRGMEETKSPIENSNDANASCLLDRTKCFGIVALAVQQIVEDSVVDLKSPELSVLVELLPLSGIPDGSFVVAVSVLPGNLVSTKPRLCIKPLTSDAREGTVVQ